MQKILLYRSVLNHEILKQPLYRRNMSFEVNVKKNQPLLLGLIIRYFYKNCGKPVLYDEFRIDKPSVCCFCLHPFTVQLLSQLQSKITGILAHTGVGPQGNPK